LPGASTYAVAPKLAHSTGRPSPGELQDDHAPTCMALPIKDGNPDYLAWIAQETQEPR
jgi:hypothetical protein